MWWLLALLLLTPCVADALATDLKCRACEVVMDELAFELQKETKASMPVGSRIEKQRGSESRFRQTKPYKRSEAHALEVLEALCPAMQHYALSTTGPRRYVRVNAREGESGPITLSGVQINEEDRKDLKNQCYRLLEENEDELMTLLWKEDDVNWRRVFCEEIAEVCPVEPYQQPEEMEVKKKKKKKKKERRRRRKEKKKKKEEEEGEEEEEQIGNHTEL